MNTRYSKFTPAFIYVSDLILLNFSLLFSFMNLKSIIANDNQAFQIFILVINLSWILASQLSKSHLIERPLVLSKALNRFLISIICHLVIAFSAFYLLKVFRVEALIMISYNLMFLVLGFFHRSILFFLLDNIRKRGYNIRRVAFLGDREIIVRLKESFINHPEYGYDIKIQINDSELDNHKIEDLMETFHKDRVNEIFICYKQLDNEFIKSLINECEQYNIKVKLVSDLLLNKNGAKLINYNGIPVLKLSTKEETEYNIRIIKRSFDIVFSLSIMIVGMPLFLLILLVTKITSRGPAFYKQQRIGYDEKPFYIYKFRSMYINAEKEGPKLSSTNDTRITKWGLMMRKTRLDELPQFWNVFKGDMSVVGPRPERQHFIEQIIKKSPDYRKLLKVKPGITSFGQVNYGYAENVEQMCDRMQFDLKYIVKPNFNDDISIIMKTVKVMIQAKGK